MNRSGLGSRVQPRYAEKRARELDRIVLDSARAVGLLDWAPQVSFQEGVGLTMDSYRMLAKIPTPEAQGSRR